MAVRPGQALVADHRGTLSRVVYCKEREHKNGLVFEVDDSLD